MQLRNEQQRLQVQVDEHVRLQGRLAQVASAPFVSTRAGPSSSALLCSPLPLTLPHCVCWVHRSTQLCPASAGSSRAPRKCGPNGTFPHFCISPSLMRMCLHARRFQEQATQLEASRLQRQEWQKENERTTGERAALLGRAVDACRAVGESDRSKPRGGMGPGSRCCEQREVRAAQPSTTRRCWR